MSLSIDPITIRARLTCSRCGLVWKSPTVPADTFDAHVIAARPAFVRGWRVYAAKRTQRAYCPDCEPTVSMYLVYGPEKMPR